MILGAMEDAVLLLWSGGLPSAEGTTVGSVTADPDRSACFWMADDRGVFRRDDAGRTWRSLPIWWADRFRSQRVKGPVVLSATGAARSGA